MAELTPKFMDLDDVYSGDELGLPYRDIMGEGIVGADDLLVSATSPASLSVDVAAGAAWVTGDTDPDFQPTYRVFNDAVVNKGITPDASQPRKVLVVAQMTDEAFAGTGREWEIMALHGTPAASPAEPTLPPSALELALIDVDAAATEIAAGDITDRRERASVGGGDVPLEGAEPGRLVLKKTTEKDVANTPTETDLLNGEIVIPAGALGTDRILRAFLVGDLLQATGAGQTFTLRIKLGATTLYADGSVSLTTDAVRRPWVLELLLGNLDADNVQFMGGKIHVGTPGGATTGIGDFGAATGGQVNHAFATAGNAAVDTSVAQTLAITVQLGASSSSYSFRLKLAKVEID